jgi:hypothetical protein
MCIIILILLCIGVPIFGFMAFNSKVSLKYEKNEMNQCVSQISGINLWKIVMKFHILPLFVITFGGILIYKKYTN